MDSKHINNKKLQSDRRVMKCLHIIYICEHKNKHMHVSRHNTNLKPLRNSGFKSHFIAVWEQKFSLHIKQPLHSSSLCKCKHICM